LERTIDLVGVGVGPSNLSLAALLDPLEGFSARFFELAERFRWHEGLMFPEASIQVSFLKDLVTLVDPTSRFSFLSFLAAHGRLYRFIHARFPRVPRWEFAEYFRWVAESLPSVVFGRRVEHIELEEDAFHVYATGEEVRARSLVLGTGLVPTIPSCARPHLSPTVFHASRFLEPERSFAGKSIAVVGGGQTGAEIVAHLLSEREPPERLAWISRRSNFLPLDESPFTNELFTPSGSDHFFTLSAEQRASMLAEQKLASDGVSLEVLETIARRIYELEFRDHRDAVKLCPDSALVGLERSGKGWRLELQAQHGERRSWVDADVVILATGFHYSVPACLEAISPRIHRTREGWIVRPDFSVDWDGPAGLRIYVQNAARHARGIADPNLSLTAWRSATIINSLIRRTVYELRDASSLFDVGFEEDRQGRVA
jgi:lysine N6-hydroxylase